MQENKEYNETNINEINEDAKRKSCFAPCILEEGHGGLHYCKHQHSFF